MYLVLCEEGREIIQGRRVKSASAYTGTHDVCCPMFAPFPQTTHHLAVVFSTFTEIPGKQVVTDMLQQCVEVIWLICKRSNWCPTESQVGPIFWLFLAFRASKMRTLTNPGFGIKTKWRRGAAHNGGGATTHAHRAQKTRFQLHKIIMTVRCIN